MIFFLFLACQKQIGGLKWSLAKLSRRLTTFHWTVCWSKVRACRQLQNLVLVMDLHPFHSKNTWSCIQRNATTKLLTEAFLISGQKRPLHTPSLTNTGHTTPSHDSPTEPITSVWFISFLNFSTQDPVFSSYSSFKSLSWKKKKWLASSQVGEVT